MVEWSTQDLYIHKEKLKSSAIRYLSNLLQILAKPILPFFQVGLVWKGQYPLTYAFEIVIVEEKSQIKGPI